LAAPARSVAERSTTVLAGSAPEAAAIALATKAASSTVNAILAIIISVPLSALIRKDAARYGNGKIFLQHVAGDFTLVRDEAANRSQQELLAGFVMGPIGGGLASGIGAMLYDLTNPAYTASARSLRRTARKHRRNVGLCEIQHNVCQAAADTRHNAARPVGDISRIHLGNAFCLLAGFVMGPIGGGLASGIGAMLYDLPARPKGPR